MTYFYVCSLDILRSFMKTLILFSLTIMFSSGSPAQSIDLGTLKNLLIQKQATLEQVYPGMSKKISTITKIPTELGICEYKETAIQTILKIEGNKIIVHSKESSSPSPTPACAGFVSAEINVIFFEEKPSLSTDLADLDASASSIRTIIQSSDIISMNLRTEVLHDDGTIQLEDVLVKYDLAKPTFNNLILNYSSTSATTGEDIADIDVYSFNLTNILFCDADDSDSCTQGDFSDILF